jgi:hypothetical protein
MSLVKRLLLISTVSVTALAAGLVSTASASRLSTGEPRFRAIWNEVVFAKEAISIRCPVTLEGSFHSRTLTKVQGTLVGFITRASVATCVGGRMRWLTSRLPWHIKHESFAGVLPNITSITYRGVGAEFQLEYTVLGLPISCLYVTAEPNSLSVTFRRDTATRQLSRVSLFMTELPSGTGGSCRSIGITGESNQPTRLGAPEAITVLLI